MQQDHAASLYLDTARSLLSATAYITSKDMTYTHCLYLNCVYCLITELTGVVEMLQAGITA